MLYLHITNLEKRLFVTSSQFPKIPSVCISLGDSIKDFKLNTEVGIFSKLMDYTCIKGHILIHYTTPWVPWLAITFLFSITMIPNTLPLAPSLQLWMLFERTEDCFKSNDKKAWLKEFKLYWRIKVVIPSTNSKACYSCISSTFAYISVYTLNLLITLVTKYKEMRSGFRLLCSTVF